MSTKHNKSALREFRWVMRLDLFSAFPKPLTLTECTLTSDLEKPEILVPPSPGGPHAEIMVDCFFVRESEAEREK